MDEDLTSSNGESKAIETRCESLANDLSAATQKSASTSTKFLEALCKRVKKPTEDKLAVSQLEIMKGMTQVRRLRLETETAISVQESAEDVFSKMIALHLKQSPEHMNLSQA